MYLANCKLVLNELKHDVLCFCCGGRQSFHRELQTKPGPQSRHLAMLCPPIPEASFVQLPLEGVLSLDQLLPLQERLASWKLLHP